MKDDYFNVESFYQRLLKYRVTLKSIVWERQETDLILLNEEQKTAIKEGEGLIREVEKKIKELENVLGLRENRVSA